MFVVFVVIVVIIIYCKKFNYCLRKNKQTYLEKKKNKTTLVYKLSKIKKKIDLKYEKQYFV